MIGPIDPVGSSETDSIRLGNLEELCQAVMEILIDIKDVAKNQSRYEHSMRKAGIVAAQFINEVKQL